MVLICNCFVVVVFWGEKKFKIQFLRSHSEQVTYRLKEIYSLSFWKFNLHTSYIQAKCFITFSVTAKWKFLLPPSLFYSRREGKKILRHKGSKSHSLNFSPKYGLPTKEALIKKLRCTRGFYSLVSFTTWRSVAELSHRRVLPICSHEELIHREASAGCLFGSSYY